MPKRALKKRKDGRYLCWYMGVPFYGHTSDEALKARDEYKGQLKAGLREDTFGTTFHEYTVEWISTYKANVAIKTYNDYARYLNHACASIGNTRLRDITASDIKRLYQEHRTKSKSFMHKYSMLLKSIFSSAVDDGIILRSPCSMVAPPPVKEGTHRALEQWERDLVSSMVGKHDLALAAMLMLYAGLRRGEALAFNVERDVDFYKGVINVRQAVAFNENQPTLKAPKSRAGAREVYLFSPLRAALKDSSGYVLKKKSGMIMSDSAWKSKWNSYICALETQLNGCRKRWYGKTAVHRALIASGQSLPPWRDVTIRPHDFRHSFCTMLYDAGVDIKTAMKWMGHSDEKMIMHIYAHLTEHKELSATYAVGKLIDDSLCSQNCSQTALTTLNTK